LIHAMIVLNGSDEVMAKGIGGRYKSHAIPRVGEFITENDSEGIGQCYRVVAIDHEALPYDREPSECGIDIHVVYSGTVVERRRELIGDAGKGE
jgi:hypothetical protein